MNSNIKPIPTNADHKLLKTLCLKLASTSLLLATAITIIIALIWLTVFKKILAFGTGLDFSKYNFFGEQASAIVQNFNPYFWWLVCILATFLVLRIIVQITKTIIQRSNYKPVDDISFEQLRTRLSKPALDVLLWAWSDTDEPLMLGDLQQARKELANGKASRLYKAQEQRHHLIQALEDIAE